MMDTAKKAYWNPYLGGIALGLLLFVSFYVTSHGIGSSGAISRVVAAVEDLVVPTHVNETPYIAEVAGGDKNPLDHWLVWEVLGTLLGGFASGLWRRRVKVETFHGPQITPRVRWGFAFLGGAIMGYGARMARGCTSGQGLSGGSVMAVGAWAFMFAMFGAGYLIAYFVRGLWVEGRRA